MTDEAKPEPAGQRREGEGPPETPAPKPPRVKRGVLVPSSPDDDGPLP